MNIKEDKVTCRRECSFGEGPSSQCCGPCQIHSARSSGSRNTQHDLRYCIIIIITHLAKEIDRHGVLALQLRPALLHLVHLAHSPGVVAACHPGKWWSWLIYNYNSESAKIASFGHRELNEKNGVELSENLHKLPVLLDVYSCKKLLAELLIMKENLGTWASWASCRWKQPWWSPTSAPPPPAPPSSHHFHWPFWKRSHHLKHLERWRNICFRILPGELFLSEETARCCCPSGGRHLCLQFCRTIVSLARPPIQPKNTQKTNQTKSANAQWAIFSFSI